MTINNSRLAALLSAIFVAAALRLVPHPPNFTPVGAMALFSGAFLGRKALAFAAPLGALLASDLLLGFYHGMTTVYATDLLIVLIGSLVASRSPLRIAAAALASSVLFFGLTNLGMWLWSGVYPHSVTGLAACFAAAIPFFQNTLAGDVFYSLVLFGGFHLLEVFLPGLRTREPQLA